MAHLQNLIMITQEELVRAGFESGHAYGKALRTIKSCVSNCPKYMYLGSNMVLCRLEPLGAGTASGIRWAVSTWPGFSVIDTN